MSELRSSGSTRLAAAGVTDVGRTREINEDNILVKPDLDLYVVADGMGGHSAGDVASGIATTSLVSFFQALHDVGAAPDASPMSDSNLSTAAQTLVTAIRKANHEIHSRSVAHAQHKGMGSTVVAALVSRDTGHIHIAHVGDSRCYRIRDGEIEQLTRDHSLINEALALKPDLTKAQIARLPKNVITRALGMSAVVQVDIRSDELLPGDTFLLCSDGLSGLVSEDKIVDILEIASDITEACELLVDEANEAGGTDNISALMIRVEGDGDDARGDSHSGPHEASISVESTRIVTIEEPASEPMTTRMEEPASEPMTTRMDRGEDAAQGAAIAEAPSIDETTDSAAKAPPVDPAVERAPTSQPTVTATIEPSPEAPAVSHDAPPTSGSDLAEAAATAAATAATAATAPMSEPTPSGSPTVVAKREDIARIVAEAAEVEISAESVELGDLGEDDDYSSLGFDVGEEEELDAAFADSFVSDHIVESFGILNDEAGPISMVRIAHCKSCGHDLIIGNRFCVECGARIET